MSVVIKYGQMWEHLKTGHRYIIERPEVMIEATMTPAVSYSLASGAGPILVRPIAEFLDGRFKKVSE